MKKTICFKKKMVISVLTCGLLCFSSSVFGQSQTLALTGNASLIINKATFQNVPGGCENTDGHYALFNDGTGNNWNGGTEHICDLHGFRYIKRMTKNTTLTLRVSGLNSFSIHYKSTKIGLGKGLSYTISDLTDPSVADIKGELPAQTACTHSEEITVPTSAREYRITLLSEESDNFISSIDFKADEPAKSVHLGVNNAFTISETGKVGINNTNPAYDLDINGTIRANEIKINLEDGADFVFEQGYTLMPLSDLDEFVSTNKHLPEVAPAAKMISEGVDMGEFQIKLLQKIEELTLYIIEQDKRIKELETGVK